jgi:quaternary ammonium compound-resistance protein SugE
MPMNAHAAWIILFVAGLFEVAWAIGLKYTEGFSRPIATSLTLVAMGASVWLLAIAMKSLPVGTAYAVWVGVGAVGTVALGIWLFDEPAGTLRLLSVGLIIAGIIGLKLTSSQ